MILVLRKNRYNPHKTNNTIIANIFYTIIFSSYFISLIILRKSFKIVLYKVRKKIYKKSVFSLWKPNLTETTFSKEKRISLL